MQPYKAMMAFRFLHSFLVNTILKYSQFVTSSCSSLCPMKPGRCHSRSLTRMDIWAMLSSRVSTLEPFGLTRPMFFQQRHFGVNTTALLSGCVIVCRLWRLYRGYIAPPMFPGAQLTQALLSCHGLSISHSPQLYSSGTLPTRHYQLAPDSLLFCCLT